VARTRPGSGSWAYAPAQGLVPPRDPASAALAHQADPLKPAKAPAAKKAPKPKLVAAWVEPKGGVCPTSHPVKAKLTSKIFHLPGMLNYDRTNPDRCYKDAPSAEKDGLRPAKR
jgi:micrococcal nuclease